MISRNSLGSTFPIKKLGDAVEFLDNLRRPVTESARNAGAYPYYGANGLQGNIDNFIFDEPLVLLAEDGGHFTNPDRGIAYRVSGKTWVNNHAHVLRPKPGIDLDFLCRVLENYDVTPFVTGTTRGKLTKAGASEIPIPIPSLPDQRRIAAILDQADALRTKRREALAQLDSLAQSIFIEMFGDPLENQKQWTTKHLGELLESITNGANADQTDSGSGWPITRIETIWNGAIDSTRVKYVEPNQDLKERYQLKHGDILFSHINSPEHIAKTALYDGQPSPMIHGINLLRLRCSSNEVNAPWLLHLLKQPSVRTYFRTRCKKAVNQASLNQQDIKSLICIVPPLELQAIFSERVEAASTHRLLHEKSAIELDKLFQSLQQKAFRGEL